MFGIFFVIFLSYFTCFFPYILFPPFSFYTLLLSPPFYSFRSNWIRVIFGVDILVQIPGSGCIGDCCIGFWLKQDTSFGYFATWQSACLGFRGGGLLLMILLFMCLFWGAFVIARWCVGFCNRDMSCDKIGDAMIGSFELHGRSCFVCNPQRNSKRRGIAPLKYGDRLIPFSHWSRDNGQG